MRFVVAFLISLLSFSIQGLSGDKPIQFDSGDIIFQTSNSNQSWAIMWATKSVYSHVGMVEVTKGKTYVLEAIGVVSKTPMEQWVARGKIGRYAVFRLKNVSKNKIDSAIKAAHTMLGRPYDRYFNFDDARIYCSELIYKAYKSAGIELGTIQKTKDLDIDNFLVRKLFKQRWRRHPTCQSIESESKCWTRVLDTELVTPDSIANDSKLEKVFSNY